MLGKYAWIREFIVQMPARNYVKRRGTQWNPIFLRPGLKSLGVDIRRYIYRLDEQLETEQNVGVLRRVVYCAE